ncbi:hypothetical protein BDN67DRAFT_490293 [Paxillus ammoniavirescens]|nr:hypothetical protein BDN67DRAFT_490293 [Paxillus ammoniavirescens]
MLFKATTGLAVLLAAFLYRSGRVAKHNFLNVPALPDAYYVGGNWSEHCSVVKDEKAHTINFCEDITFWDHRDAEGRLSNRYVLLGCDPNRKAWNTVMGPLRDPEPRGYLWLYSTTDGSSHPVTLHNYPNGHDFHPLGMDIYPSENGTPSNLFIVNHARERTTIEQFTIDPARPEQATYIRTLSSPYFVAPNAIALTSATSFYVSNDHLMTRRLPHPFGRVLPVFETTAALPLGWLAHVSIEDDGTLHHTFAALGVPFANGVSLSPDGSQVALASTTRAEVYFYARNTTTNVLRFADRVPVPFFVDNIMYDDSASLIVTGHPHFLSLVAVAANETAATAPSWAISISPISKTTQFASANDAKGRTYDSRAPLSVSEFLPPTLNYEVETVFQSNGSVFSSSSTTLRDSESGTLYVAGLYEEGMMVCHP